MMEKRLYKHLCFVLMFLPSIAVSQEDEAARRAADILNALSSGSEPVLFQPSFKRFMGGDFPVLGLAGFSSSDGSGETMVFIPCGGKQRKVSKDELDDTREFCPDDSGELPITLVVDYSEIEIFSRDFDTQLTWTASTRPELLRSWSAADHSVWLERARQASEGLGVSPIEPNAMNKIVIQQLSIGGGSILTVGVPDDVNSYVVWNDLPPLNDSPDFGGRAPNIEGLS